MSHPEEIAMSHVLEMLKSHPTGWGELDPAKLTECIEACFDCAQACTACADACLAEDVVSELVQCIRTDLDCADVCATTGTVLSRHAGSDASLTKELVEACRTACRACAADCESHASMHEHCRICAQACRRCEAACDQLASALG
jgi:hypothetical protein